MEYKDRPLNCRNSKCKATSQEALVFISIHKIVNIQMLSNPVVDTKQGLRGETKTTNYSQWHLLVYNAPTIARQQWKSHLPPLFFPHLLINRGELMTNTYNQLHWSDNHINLDSFTIQTTTEFPAPCPIQIYSSLCLVQDPTVFAKTCTVSQSLSLLRLAKTLYLT